MPCKRAEDNCVILHRHPNYILCSKSIITEITSHAKKEAIIKHDAKKVHNQDAH
jgi:hypothetical protein